MRQPSEKAESVRMAMRQGVVDGVGVKILASSEVDAREWEKTLSGEKPTISRALAAFGSAYQEFRALHPDDALRWGAGVLAAMGFDREVLCRAIEVKGTAEVRTEEMQAVAAVAKVVDADLTAAPVEVRVALAGAAVRETTEMYVALQKQQGQPALALGTGR